MKEILIINLTRLGDLLQTTPLMAGFKEKYGANITLLANSLFAETCRGIPFIDHLILFDLHGFRDKVLKKEYSLVGNYRTLDELINSVNENEYDLVMNLTHSSISALITSLVRTKEIRGYTVDNEGHRVIKHPWLRYFFNVIPNRDYNPFHLVDMYLKAGGVSPEHKGLCFNITEEDEKKAGEILRSAGVENEVMLFGIHLGASKSDKTWPVSSFAALADMITAEYNAKVVLFGSPSEKSLGSEFEAAARSKPINFIGRTKLGELYALLKKCSLLISNDTGPLHLATAAGTKVIDIFTANVHFLETGPYGEGHYVMQADIPCAPCGFNVQCNNMVCKDVIKPEAVFEVAREIISGKPLSAAAGSAKWSKLQVYKTRFRDNGLLGFIPLFKRPLTREIFYRVIYREVWSTKQQKTDGIVDGVCNNVFNELSSLYSLDGIDELLLSLGKDINVIEQLAAFAKEGIRLAGIIAEEAGHNDIELKKIKKNWESLEAIDRNIKITGHANPCLGPFMIIFDYSKEALEGNDLLKLANDTRGIYKDLLSGTAYMLRLMKKIKLFLEPASCTGNARPDPQRIHGTEYTVSGSF